MSRQIPPKTQVVVIGGGVIGCSVAYHLCKRGWTDVVVLERSQLTSGTTWHAAGLIGTTRSSQTLAKLAGYCLDFIPMIEEETEQQVGFRQVGSMWIAEDEERFEEIRRLNDVTKIWGPETHLLTPDEIEKHYPLINKKGLVGGMLAPAEGWASPVDFTMAIAKGVRQRGGKIFEGVSVTDINTDNGRVSGVETDQGMIETDFVVNCAGLWAREIGKMVDVDIPLYPCEHYYVVTEKSDDIPKDLPVMRDQSNEAYYKEDAGSILLGAFEKNAIPVDPASLSDGFSFGELPGDMDHFMPVLEAAMERVPLIGELGMRKFFCGPESFTPDDQIQMGKAPGIDGFYMAAGANSVGIQTGPGYGKALADWIVDGRAPYDLHAMDVRRNEPYQNTKAFLSDRVSETLGLLYENHFPYRQFASARGARRSPLHEHLKARGACFGVAGGWERANWFAPEGVEPVYEYSFKRQNWFEYSKAEHMAFRENVGLIDLTSFAKFIVQGPDAMAVLQNISSANVDVAVGRIVYTHWLDEQAGVEADLTVARMAEDRYQVTTGGAVAQRDMDWLKRHIPENARVEVFDASSAIAIIGVFGPRSRELLEGLSGADLSNESCPFSHWVDIEVGYAKVRAMRVTFVGELGWELHVASEFAAHVFEVVEEAGKAYGLKLCGLHALDSCRIEKGYRHFGHEVSQDETPFDAGLGFVCNFNAGEFIGRDAAAKAKAEPKRKRLVQVQLKDPEPLLIGHEPLLRNGDVVGYVTSGAYGHFVGTAVGMAWLKNADGVTKEFMESGEYQVLVAGQKVDAEVSFSAAYDPKGERVKM